jgi:D-psicose/D-tagatose/L-ribulose 3-epimerase
MKLGVSAFAWTAKFERRHLEILPAIREMGFQGFEIPMFDPRKLAVSDIRRSCKANDLECTVCAILPAGINPISPDAAVRRKALLHLIECIQTSAELGATILGGPLYAPIGYLPKHRPTEDEWSWAVEAFQAVRDLLDTNEITLSIEPVNRSETFFLRTAKEGRELCEAVGHPRVGVTIDTFHANIEEASIPSALRSLGAKLMHLHASENDRGLLGSGHVDFAAIISTLKQIGYSGYLMVEGFGYSPDEKNAPGLLWADPTVSPRDLASKGADFLRKHLRD